MTEPLHTSLHRTAKYFMDSGRVRTTEEAMDLLKSFGLTIVCGPEIRASPAAQIALLTLVNLARRTFLAGVEIVGLEDVPVLTQLSLELDLVAAVSKLGGRAVQKARPAWPFAIIGSADMQPTELPAWRMTWQGWRAGVVPIRDAWAMTDDESMPLAPALAASICAAEVFSFHAGDRSLSGRRASGLSIWRPGSDWMAPDDTEATLSFLPSRLWLIGLGNLGQAYSWLLACLPYQNGGLELVLQDFDRLALSNDSTSVLTNVDVLGQMKTRWAAEWLEARGIRTYLEERRFTSSTKRQTDEPAVALCGVDNALARSVLEDAGFDLIIESGLGAGPQSFRNFAMHTFPGPRRATELWPTTISAEAPEVSHMPAYTDLKDKGVDACGLAQLASRTVGVPFVGLIAGAFVISELLRRLNGGTAYDVIAGSITCLDDLDVCAGASQIYDFGFSPVSPASLECA
ncbi:MULTISPECIES: hypothetical protein [Asticcacaulis]|uniref:hypothetical protein n=1 Tax=Asticcacaulis TaxID=76890 RepID=UPI001AE4C254|nr:MULTISPECIES: hypothetical protein [Asticcacaulis]MBP2157488.1 hypothetical protein [Asticcacaulis solisilvae]MDR6798533.1 hypothetical protein [Asticcacaulis sp. BE141]